MITHCCQINEALQLVPTASEDAPAACQRSDERTWLDLQDFENGELETWLDKLAVTGLSRRLCLEARERPGIFPLKNEIFMVIPVLIDAEELYAVDYIAFLCRENLLLTLHRKTIIGPEELDEAEAWLPGHSIAGLVSAVMIFFSLERLRHITDLRKAIAVLEEKMDREPEAVDAEEILDLRSALLAHEAVLNDQLPAVKVLCAIDKPFFKLADSREYMNCALANMQAAERILDRLGATIGTLHSGFQMHAQDQTNRRLNMLTILSAIFMPITLLAGIWGMNFEVMPELKFRLAYPLALGFMGLVGWAMYSFFRKGGWFD